MKIIFVRRLLSSKTCKHCYVQPSGKKLKLTENTEGGALAFPVFSHLFSLAENDRKTLPASTYDAETPKRPVVMHIHPGGFYSRMTGASTMMGPQYLMDHDIVLVTINYRLGTLGFLSTGTAEAPGNAGLKDQVQALRWIRENIASFGGDPDCVTVMGYSAGGAGCTLHLVSPMSKGLFHRAICMSGSSLGQWPVPTKELTTARLQAKILGCPENVSIPEMVSCLKTKDAQAFGESFPQFDQFGGNPGFRWKPVVEDDFGQERFLNDHPVRSILQGDFYKVPVMLGITDKEFGYGAVATLYNETLREQLQNDWERLAPILFVYDEGIERDTNITKSLKEFYLDNKSNIDNTSLEGLSELWADSVIGFGVNRAAKLLADKDFSVYYYKFSYPGRYSFYYMPGTNGTVPYGVVHHDDLSYLYFISKLYPFYTQNDPESEMVAKLTTLWASFAKTGRPAMDQRGRSED